MPATVWKGDLTFGLVSIPVRLFRAARRERHDDPHWPRWIGLRPCNVRCEQQTGSARGDRQKLATMHWGFPLLSRIQGIARAINVDGYIHHQTTSMDLEITLLEIAPLKKRPTLVFRGRGASPSLPAIRDADVSSVTSA